MSDYFYWRSELNQLPEQVSNLWKDYSEFFFPAPGSLHNHQAWSGGYLDHIQETFMIAEDFYKIMNEKRKLPFSLEDAKLVLFLHDLEKPFKYASEALASKEPVLVELAKEDPEQLRQTLINKYNIPIDEYKENALKNIHGENENYSNTKRASNELAAFVHICDMVSARIWYDYPGSSLL